MMCLSDSPSAAGLLHKLLDRILEHMDHEEKTFLNEVALGEVDAVFDQFGG
jgi:hypothetical protein